MKNEKCGVYGIRCRATEKLYVGSSGWIYRRWSQHRWYLRRNKSPCVHLQNAWNRHGEDAFQFFVIEECEHALLEEREQHYIDELRPAFNSINDVKRRTGPEMIAKRAAAVRAYAATITHCPHGHAYDEANTHINKKGKRICRACAAERMNAKYAVETPEETARRKAQVKALYERQREARIAKQQAYASTRKAEKSAYDRARRERMKGAAHD